MDALLSGKNEVIQEAILMVAIVAAHLRVSAPYVRTADVAQVQRSLENSLYETYTHSDDGHNVVTALVDYVLVSGGGGAMRGLVMLTPFPLFLFLFLFR